MRDKNVPLLLLLVLLLSYTLPLYLVALHDPRLMYVHHQSSLPCENVVRIDSLADTVIPLRLGKRDIPFLNHMSLDIYRWLRVAYWAYKCGLYVAHRVDIGWLYIEDGYSGRFGVSNSIGR